jgi:hypothetical protein
VLSVPVALQPMVFGAFNVGVAALVLGLLAERSLAVQAGGTLLAAAGVLYAIAAGRTLTFSVRDPPGDPSPLSILP